MVNNNPATNDSGYRFTSYMWYVNDWFNGNDTNQTLLSGSSYRDKFNHNDLYRVKLVTVHGDTLQTCPDRSGVMYNDEIKYLYPNPVSKVDKIYFANPLDVQDYQTATLYTIQGHKLWQKRAAEVGGGFTAPSVSGAYILLLQGEVGTARYKIIVN
jgi:hypothetical protein